MPWLLLYISKGSPVYSLLVSILNPIEFSPVSYSISPSLCPWSVKWGIISHCFLFFFFSFFLLPLSQPGLYSLLLLVCVLHPFKIFFLYCRNLIFMFCNILIPVPPLLKRNGKLLTKRVKWNGGNQTIRYGIQKNGYKDGQRTHWQLPETEWTLQQHVKIKRNYKQEPGRNEEYNIWNNNNKIH